MKPSKQEYRESRFLTIQIKQLLFFGFLVIGCFIGLLWFFRPTVSQVEKRDLTEFPKLSLQGLWDGTFFNDESDPLHPKGLSTWYADTYPLREQLIDLNSKLQSHYGNRSERLVNGGKADEIPTGTMNPESLSGKTTTEPIESTKSGQPAETERGNTPVTAESSTPETTDYDGHGAADVDGDATQVDDIYILNGAGYGVYYFNQSDSEDYCRKANQLAKNLEGKAQLYCMLCPISAGVMLSEETREKIGCSDEAKATEWIYQNMDPSVKTVSMVNALRAHNDEYIFFRTDHHWTALGAYYAYREWCKVKGVTPHELSFFEDTYTFDGFLGTFYSKSGKDPSLARNPDTVYAYVPNGTNTMTFFTDYNSDVYNEYQWKIVYDVSNYPDSELYGTFAGGDPPYAHAHNEEITDGSSVLVVKDSYANAFIPFLIDHYEHVYWIDFRYYKTWCEEQGYTPTISALVEREGIQDVILCQNICFIGSSQLQNIMK